MVRLKDIADKAGVSTASVSLALSGKGRISEEKRKHIEAIAAELGYKTKQGTAKPHDCAVMLLPIHSTRAHAWHFLRKIIDYIQSEMTARNFTSLILPILEGQPVSEIIEIIMKTGATAIYSIHYGNAALFSALERRSLPLVVVNNSEYQNRYWSVCVDDFGGSYEACKILQAYGHKQITYIDYPRPSLQVLFRDRFNGFQSAMNDANISSASLQRLTRSLDEVDALKRDISRLYDSPNPPSALLIHDDFLACRIYHIMSAMGISIPQEVSLLAPGDTIDYKAPEAPDLSTMKIDTSLMAKYAVDLMISQIEQQDQSRETAPRVLKIRQHLYDRGSIAWIKE